MAVEVEMADEDRDGGGGGRPSVTPASTSQAQEKLARWRDVAAMHGCWGEGSRMLQRWRRRRRELASGDERLGNPSGQMGRVFLPRGNRWEAGCNSLLGGLPKGARFWPREGWHGGGWSRKKARIPRESGLPKEAVEFARPSVWEVSSRPRGLSCSGSWTPLP